MQINDLIIAVNVALGSLSLTQCPSIDTSGDTIVSIDELIRAVNEALSGCV